jgi:hypothetical protein
MANAGLFDQGVVLIGTAAFQTYAGMIGHYLPDVTLITNDADIPVASFSATSEPKDLETILQNANPSFRAQMHFDDRLPRLFRSDDGFAVDVLTKYGRGRKSPVLLDDLGCSAEAMKYMEYLAEESVEAVVLYGSGVLVKVPPPVRFAIHKLLIAPERRGRFMAKRSKDLGQARDLIDIFVKIDSAALEDALDDARSRGTKWKKNINASLREIGRDTRPGHPPLPLTKAKNPL